MKKYIFLLSVFLFPCFLVSTAQVDDNEQRIPKGSFLPASVKNRTYDLVRNETQLKNETKSIFSENFENKNTGWIFEGDWKVGQAQGNTIELMGSSFVAGTGLKNKYVNNADYRLISPIIVLPGLSNLNSHIELTYLESFSLESEYDFGKVEISTDNGVTWTTLDNRTGTINISKNLILLDTYEGQKVKIAFHLTSDESINSDGWFIDDISIKLSTAGNLSATLTNLSPQNFPFIYMNIAVNENGIGINSLNQTNFQAFENNALQTDFLEVTPPAQGSGSRLADIIFLVDNSGSFRDFQNAVYNNMVSFIDQLKTSDINYALGLCRFGQGANSGRPILEDAGQLSTNADYFKNTVWGRNVVDGRLEPAYYAITQSISGFSFRPGSQKIFIILADENPAQGYSSQQDAIDAVKNNLVTLFALTTSKSAGLNLVATESNGRYYNIMDPFNNILDDISTIIGNTYLVRYRSSNPTNDGTERTVRVDITHQGDATSVTGSYFPGAAPDIARTQTTVDLEKDAWAEHTQFTIEADITDAVQPITSGAMLYYKNTSSSSWKQIVMTNTSGNRWSAQIPTGDILKSGLDYYITATDGQLTSSSPRVEPTRQPFQIAILPNVKPSIAHTQITEFSSAQVLRFEATVADQTNTLDKVKIYIRNTGQLLYQSNGIEMNNSGGDQFFYEYQTTTNDNAGIEYYIAAWDDFGVQNSVGDADHPLKIELTANEKPVLNHTPLTEYIVGGNTTFEAEATDSDGTISEVTLYIRETGKSYQSFSMTTNEKDKYAYVFVATSEQENGFEYYIAAKDDQNETNQVGSESNPNKLAPVWDLGFRPDEDGWNFSNNWAAKDIPNTLRPDNYSEYLPDDWIMWPKYWWKDIDYCSKQYPLKWCLYRSSRYPSWDLMVQAYGEEISYLKPPPDAIYNPIVVKLWNKKSYSVKKKKDAIGACFGFAISSLLYYTENLKIDNKGVEDQSLIKFKLNDSSRNLINKYFIYQWTEQFQEHAEKVWNYTPTQTLNELKKRFVSQTPVSLFFHVYSKKKLGGKKNSIGHIVVPYKISKISDIIYSINVYDNNSILGSREGTIYLYTNTNEWGFYPYTSELDPKYQIYKTRLMPGNLIENYLQPSEPDTRKGRDIMQHKNIVNSPNIFLILSSPTLDIQIKNSSEGILGYSSREGLFENVTNGHPIIDLNPDSTNRAPSGYFLPKDDLKIDLTTNEDNELYLGIYSSTLNYHYSRPNANINQSDLLLINSQIANSSFYKQNISLKSANNLNFSYSYILSSEEFSDKGISIVNHDQSDKVADLEIIIPSDSNVKIFRINNFTQKKETKISFNIINSENLLLSNDTGVTTYNLKTYIGTTTKEFTIEFDSINIESNTSHLIIPAWNNLDEESVLVLIDDNEDGIFTDTMKLTTRINTAPSVTDQFFSLNEFSENGSVIGSVQARDPDDGQDLKFSIIGGNQNEAFTIDPFSGTLYVNNKDALNYGQTPEFSLLVKVRDNGQGFLSDTATITIQLINQVGTGWWDNTAIGKFNVYPIPSNGIYQIVASDLKNQDIHIRIYDTSNRLIFERKYTSVMEIQDQIDIADKAAGLYFMKVIGDKGTFTVKLIKQ